MLAISFLLVLHLHGVFKSNVFLRRMQLDLFLTDINKMENLAQIRVSLFQLI